MLGGRPRAVYRFTISGEKITAIDLIANQRVCASSTW